MINKKTVYPKQKENLYSGTILSAKPPQQILSVKQQNELYAKLRQKQILEVFIEQETNKKLITHSAAYDLKITSVRAIMLDSPKYYEISQSKIEELQRTGLYEIQYIQLPPKVKQNIRVYYEDNYFYIDSGAAYALGYMDVEKFNSNNNLYGPLKDAELSNIKNNFNIEFINIKEDRAVIKK